jgi:PRTRC genetic system ThiF family protein
MKLTHTKFVTLHLPPYHRVNITLVGCGGTGSHLASGLAALILALRERDIQTRLMLVDPDRVEEKNVGRQLFGRAEIGLAKAGTLALRLGQVYTVPIDASIRVIGAGDTFVERDSFNLVIGAVDNAAARATIAKAVVAAAGQLWWLDCGNENRSGQITLGNAVEPKAWKPALGMVASLPAPHVIYPELIQKPKKTTKRQNCADATAAGEQGLMVNRMVAAWALALLHDLFLGQLKYFGLTFDLLFAGTRAYLLDEPTLKEI